MGRGSSERARQLAATGLTGQALFEALVSEALERKQARVANRCPRCWHDKVQRCICRRLGRLHTSLRVRVLVLMHSKEWMCASDDAKLLVAMLPADRVRLYVYGRAGDLDALSDELRADPAHTLVLWPGDGACTVSQWMARLPAGSARALARSRAAPADAAANDAPPPLLRVLALDGVYHDANAMWRHLVKRGQPPPHVALHPKTLSVYSRAQHGYAQARRASPLLAPPAPVRSTPATNAVPTPSSAVLVHPFCNFWAEPTGECGSRVYLGYISRRRVRRRWARAPTRRRCESARSRPSRFFSRSWARPSMPRPMHGAPQPPPSDECFGPFTGEPASTTRALVGAVVANNEAIACVPGSGPALDASRGRRAIGRKGRAEAGDSTARDVASARDATGDRGLSSRSWVRCEIVPCARDHHGVAGGRAVRVRIAAR